MNDIFEIRKRELLNHTSDSPIYNILTVLFLFYFILFLIVIDFVAPRFVFKRHMSHNYFIQNIVADGGEGIILRKCGSLYEPGRSFSLLKLKV
jgi:hypothetical protein